MSELVSPTLSLLTMYDNSAVPGGGEAGEVNNLNPITSERVDHRTQICEGICDGGLCTVSTSDT